MPHILSLLLICLLAGCAKKQRDANRDDSPIKDTASVATNSRDSILPECELLQRYPESMERIYENPLLLKGIQDDSCFFALADTIVNTFSATGDVRHIQCLDAIASVSDGFVAEYMSDAAVSIFLRRSIDMIKYLHGHDEYGREGLEESLIIGMRGEIHYPASTTPLKAEIDSITDADLHSNLLSPKEKEYLRALHQQWQKEEDDE